MNKEILVQEWLDHSRKDLDSAEFLTRMMPEPLEIICFHCQQSVEKAMKAYLSFINLRPPHSVGNQPPRNFSNNFRAASPAPDTPAPPMAFTRAEPTMAASAIFTTAFTCSGC